MKNITINIIFFFITIMILIAGVEILLRCTHLFNARIAIAKPDPLLGWSFVPNGRYWSNSENNHPISGKFNSFGWRDREWSVEKETGILRIAVLGDSFVEAFQVESEKSFLQMTEQIINKKNKNKVELMNFGRSGCTQTEELLILKNYVSRFSPDMVVLFFAAVNDIEDVSFETAPDKIRPFYKIEKGQLILDTSFTETRSYKIKSFINWFKLHSILVSLLCERYNYYQGFKNISREKDNQSGKLEPYITLCTANANPKFLVNYQLNKELIKEMKSFCRSRGIRFMLSVIDISSYLPENEQKYKSIDPSFNTSFFEDDLKTFAESISADYLGLQKLFRKSYENNHIPLHWGHWNYEGHKVVARGLADKLNSIFSKHNNLNNI
jgi:hypothetical protein